MGVGGGSSASSAMGGASGYNSDARLSPTPQAATARKMPSLCDDGEWEYQRHQRAPSMGAGSVFSRDDNLPLALSSNPDNVAKLLLVTQTR